MALRMERGSGPCWAGLAKMQLWCCMSPCQQQNTQPSLAHQEPAPELPTAVPGPTAAGASACLLFTAWVLNRSGQAAVARCGTRCVSPAVPAAGGQRRGRTRSCCGVAKEGDAAPLWLRWLSLLNVQCMKM